MKNIPFFLIILAITLAACSGAVNTPAAVSPITNPASTQALTGEVTIPTANSSANLVAEEEIATVDQAANSSASIAQAGVLTEADVHALLYMREEEKLAHDVYLALYNQWQLPIFQNIASSEQMHMDSVKSLLDRYGLQDPAWGTAGVFTDQTLQDLYNQLVAQGSQSLAEALKAGAAIEEIDILDLEQSISQASQPDIALVYQNLLNGSQNHLRSFVATLQNQTGETYQAQYMSQDAVQTILGASTQRGGPGGQGGQTGQGGRGRGRGQS